MSSMSTTLQGQGQLDRVELKYLLHALPLSPQRIYDLSSAGALPWLSHDAPPGGSRQRLWARLSGLRAWAAARGWKLRDDELALAARDSASARARGQGKR